ncbi:DNA-methyltransferase [Knoellia sp. LjRoot47]|uniref:DNA-methyltransferase n=1 Tax=Knoellia sp. LjRoot47 TaxID=3342330 RepID=UPI003ECE6341
MSIYYQDESVTLHLGDWREEIASDFCADLILTDPPYGETALDWDRWPAGWVSLAARHAQSMWCFGSMRMFLDQKGEFSEWTYSQEVVWEKHNGSSLARDRFSRVHEFATFWYQGPWADRHHQTPTTADSTARTVRRKPKPAQWQGARGASEYVSIDGGPRLMRSVIYQRSMHGRAINETEKPVPLLEPLIQYGCPVGGTVVDFYAGSSATLVAARNLGREAVGFEKRESQCEKAALRLSQGVLDLGEVTA